MISNLARTARDNQRMQLCLFEQRASVHMKPAKKDLTPMLDSAYVFA